MRSKSIILTGDWHCGHEHGLTHPDEFDPLTGCRMHSGEIQRALWGWFSGKIDKIREDYGIDLMVSNGDAIDGDGRKSGGTEQIKTDRNYQVIIATKCAEYVNAKKILLFTEHRITSETRKTLNRFLPQT